LTHKTFLLGLLSLPLNSFIIRSGANLLPQTPENLQLRKKGVGYLKSWHYRFAAE